MFNPRKYPPIERNPDGSLIQMTTRQRWGANRLIRARCCNCDQDNCLLLDRGEEVICPQLLSHSVCCTYFRNVLLKEAEAKALETTLFRKDDLRCCARCGKSFTAHGNRAKYCDDCKIIAKREQQADYAKRRRSKRRKIEP